MGSSASIAGGRDPSAAKSLRLRVERILDQKRGGKSSETSECLREFVELYDQSEAGLELHITRFRDLMNDVMCSIAGTMPLQSTARVFIEHAKRWAEPSADPSLMGIFIRKTLVEADDSDCPGFGLICVGGDPGSFSDVNDIQDFFISSGQELADQCIGMNGLEKEAEQGETTFQLLAIPVFTYDDADETLSTTPASPRKPRRNFETQATERSVGAANLLQVPEEGSAEDVSETKSSEAHESNEGELSLAAVDGASTKVGGVMVFCQRKGSSAKSTSEARVSKELRRLFAEAGGFLKQAVQTELRQERLHHSQQMLTASMDSSYIFNNTKDVFHTLTLYEDYVKDLLAAEHCMVLLVDDTNMQLWHRRKQGSSARISIKEDSALGEAVTTGIPVRLNDREALSKAEEMLLGLTDGDGMLTSSLCVPIGTEFETFGVVIVLNKKMGEEVSWPQARSKHTSLRMRSYSSRSLMAKMELSKSIDSTYAKSPIQMRSSEYAGFTKAEEKLLCATIGDLTDLISFKYLDLTYMMQASTENGEASGGHLQSLLSMYDPKKRKVNARSGFGSTSAGGLRKEGSLTTFSIADDGRGVHMSSHLELNSSAALGAEDEDLGAPIDGYSQYLDSWDLDILSLSEDHLVGCALAIVEKFHVRERFNIQTATLNAFVEEVRKNYLPNPYHNFAHGVSVLHGSSMMLCKGISSLLKVGDVLALLVGALCHDVGHPGTNNDFQVSSGSSLAILYNDISVLENFHASKTFQILQKDTCNIFASVEDKLTRQQLRETIVKAILSTDISKHFKLIDDLKAKYQAALTEQVSASMNVDPRPSRLEKGGGAGPLSPPDIRAAGRRMTSMLPMRRGTFSVGASAIKRKQTKAGAMADPKAVGRAGTKTLLTNEGETEDSAEGPLAGAQGTYAAVNASSVFAREKREDRLLLVEMVIHSADLSNPVLRFDLYQGWTDLVVQEFYNQSLQERALGLPSQAHMCSAPDDLLAKAKLQVSFVDFIVGPLWAVVQDIFPQLADRYETLEGNRAAWKKIVDRSAIPPGSPERGEKLETFDEQKEQEEQDGTTSDLDAAASSDYAGKADEAREPVSGQD